MLQSGRTLGLTSLRTDDSTNGASDSASFALGSEDFSKGLSPRKTGEGFTDDEYNAVDDFSDAGLTNDRLWLS